MIRGGDFYAIWNDAIGLWCKDEITAIRLIDKELEDYYIQHKDLFDGSSIRVMYLWDADSGSIDKWHKYVQHQMFDNFHTLDGTIIFSDKVTTREDYASHQLTYPLQPTEIKAYEELIDTLYLPEERHKIEWAIGSVISGASKSLQKFFVFYGAAGTGKSTVLNIIQELFDGYYSTFEAETLASKNDSFALEAFAKNPLIAIQHDGDLSKIETNTRLNSIVSHEEMVINQKFKSLYSAAFDSVLFMGSNRPVKITDAKSGILRRLIDISPTGNKVPSGRYRYLMDTIKFELGGIACHCLDVFNSNPNFYNDYIPEGMMGASNDFYDFIMEVYDIFEKDNYTTLDRAWRLYKEYSEAANLQYPMNRRVFKEELKNYFKEFHDRKKLDDAVYARNVYYNFVGNKFAKKTGSMSEDISWIDFQEQHSKLDDILADNPAQYASEEDTPLKSWAKVRTKLKDINTNDLHFVKLSDKEETSNHIVIDFDLKENGEKSFEKNLKAANKWPPTYAELSKSGSGIHLHYIYDGDPSLLERLYDIDIEIKVFTGNSSLRRKLTKCNDLDISTISSGLPLKEKKMINFDGVKNEKKLRVLIKKNLNKEIHPNTKPSIDFIHYLLEEAYNSGMVYDVTDLRNDIFAFATESTNNADYCMKKVQEMKFKSENTSEAIEFTNDDIIFFDVEVFPNLFVVVWKAPDKDAVKMINPKPEEIEQLLKFKLVGFNCRRYDNHILYARYMGYDEQMLYELSQRIIRGDKGAFFGEAYNISYTDIYDFSSKKQSLKKFEIDLGIHHLELGLPWDQPVPEDKWPIVAEYCINDVLATQAVFEDRKADWDARQILAEIAGLSPNDTTNSLTTRIIFGNERKPQKDFVYTDLSTIFPGYEFKDGRSSYRGEDPKEGGYVYAEPGMYTDVALLDVASMHPTSIELLNLFGPYTERFSAIKQARIFIKHKDYESASKMFDGKLQRYLNDEYADSLAYALKIAINSVYGLTSAKFDNICRDPRNVDNIVAKRGALFMIDLKHAVQEKGFTVAHIKTDSIKIPNATPEIIDFVMEFGKKYGYTFEHEATYKKMCLVNDAVYIAQTDDGTWTATGKQFQVPFVFKTLFSKEEIVFEDLCETKAVQTSLYLDMNENLESLTHDETKFLEKVEKALHSESEKDICELAEKQKCSVAVLTSKYEELLEKEAASHNYIFIGKVGNFCPIKPGCGGGILLRDCGGGKYAAAVGSSGYRWLESEIVRTLHKEDDVDISFYRNLVDEAIAALEEYGDVEWFISD